MPRVGRSTKAVRISPLSRSLPHPRLRQRTTCDLLSNSTLCIVVLQYIGIHLCKKQKGAIFYE